MVKKGFSGAARLAKEKIGHFNSPDKVIMVLHGHFTVQGMFRELGDTSCFMCK